MRGKAAFSIEGLVGSVKTVGKTRKISIAVDASYKNDAGEWQKRTIWNTVTVFEDRMVEWIDSDLTKGDMVSVDGHMGENNYKNAKGDIVYTVDLTARRFERLATKAQLDSTRNQNDDEDQAA